MKPLLSHIVPDALVAMLLALTPCLVSAQTLSEAKEELKLAPGKYCKASDDDFVLKILEYADTLVINPAGMKMDAYSKVMADLKNSNFVLKYLPTMKAIEKNDGYWFAERYSSLVLKKDGEIEETVLAEYNSLTDKEQPLSVLSPFLTPTIYSEALFQNKIISPFSRKGNRFYRYKTVPMDNGTVAVGFRPKTESTQLVSGCAVVKEENGQVLNMIAAGEFDMVSFSLQINLREDSPALARSCILNSTFEFMGNQIDVGATRIFIDQMRHSPSATGDTLSLAELRPMNFTKEEEAFVSELLSSKEGIKEELLENESGLTVDAVSDFFFNSIKSSGKKKPNLDVRLSAFLNPKVLSYSKRRGITYRAELIGKNTLSDNSCLSFRFKLGYMFKHNQFYFDAPLTYTFNARRNGQAGLRFTVGNRIINSSISQVLKETSLDDSYLDGLELNYFKNRNIRLNTSYDIADWLNIDLSLGFYERVPTEKEDYEELDLPTSYRTFAPAVDITIKPWKDRGPVLNANYEWGLKGVLGSKIAYDKVELDAQWLKYISPIHSLSLRMGAGFYTNKSEDIYFYDFNNFKENNLPGGWNDDWSGDFQVLNSSRYNLSDYYFRTNITYESPMLFASYLPLLGRYIESERIYVNGLIAEYSTPYAEYGYGFATRLFSIGVYFSMMNHSYYGMGCRLSFELFHRWE